MMFYRRWRAALMGALITFGWILLFLLSLLSPILPSLLLAPTVMLKGLGVGVTRDGQKVDLRKVLEGAASTAHQVGALSIDPGNKSQASRSYPISQLLKKSPALAGVIIYRSDGTLLEAHYPAEITTRLRNPPNSEMRMILRDARQGAWIVAPDADKGTLFYYAASLQKKGQPRTYAVGIVTAASLQEHARRLEPSAAQESPVFYFARRGGWLFDWRLALLAASVLVGISFLGRYLLTRRVRGSLDGLVKLVRAYGERRFSEPLHAPIQSEFEPLRMALVEMAEKLARSDKELIRRERMESALSRFFPPSQAAEIADGQRSLNLNGQRRVISVVFVHVVGYSDYVKSAPPTEIVALLQEIFSLVSELCFRQGGVMDKSVGDCMVALFGAHELQTDHAQRALAAAEDIERFIAANASRWKQEHAFDVELAIGVSSGEAIVGDLGSEADLEYTAVGEVVSTAARLAAMARPGQVLVSSDVKSHLPATTGFELNSVNEQPLWSSGSSLKVLELA